ncbi:hypothetical protein Pyn_21471 [Prunus yedoensis var. nudiflora]|uniref:Uncharacterized protein n=1 Tax=Prunus yedoensis var. nudiflora TaxID=2094558 RepID=A0A314ULL5_PRUYE|nr:hypothetical protein Pyn_21471 [Prunus yedoensis var. nudiflora]
MREKLLRGKEGKGTRAQLGLKGREKGIERREGIIKPRGWRGISIVASSIKLVVARLGTLNQVGNTQQNLARNYKILFWKRGADHQMSAVKNSMASIASLESVSEDCYWERNLIDYFSLILKVVNHYFFMINLMLARSNGQDYTENINRLLYWLNQLRIEVCLDFGWRFQDLGEVPSSSLKFSYMDWWLLLWINHYFLFVFPIYTKTWRWIFIYLQDIQFSY